MNKRLLRLLPLLAVIGPGIISGSVDNDAGGIATYSIAGASFGTSLLWVLVVTSVTLAITQEVGARLGLVTGKGLAALIREKFGVRWTTFIMAILLIANIGTIAAEFAGIASSFEIFHVNRFISIPIIGCLIYFAVTKWDFKKLEKIFLICSAFYLVYVFSALLAHPVWSSALINLVTPKIQFTKSYWLTLIAVVGTTITPWGQFFIQDYVVDKKLTRDDLTVERGDVFFGSFVTNIISFFIIVACAATLFIQHIPIQSASDAALALQPFAGQFATILFAVGLLNASIFGASLVPVATSYVVSEAFGFESGLNHTFKEAPEFYGLFTFLLFIGGLMVLLPFVPLITILFISQAINAILLLPILVFLFLLSNDKRLLQHYTNGKIINIILLISLIAIGVSAIAYAISTLF